MRSNILLKHDVSENYYLTCWCTALTSCVMSSCDDKHYGGRWRQVFN